MYILPFRDLDIKTRQSYREQIQRTLLNRALALGLARSQNELVIRDLFPDDLGLTDWSVPDTAPFINCTMTTFNVIGIYKVLQLGINPTASEVVFLRGHGYQCIARYNIETCYAGLPIIKNLGEALMNKEAREVLNRMTGKEAEVSPTLGSPMEGYFTEPVIYDPQDRMTVNVKVKSPSDNYLVLGGFVCERQGGTVV